MLDVFDMVVAIVFIVTIGKMFSAYMTSRARRSRLTHDSEIFEKQDDFEARIKRLEGRLGNVETIVLEDEKLKKFDNAL